MKNKNNKFSISLSILFISFLIVSTSAYEASIEAEVSKEQIQNNIDSYTLSSWQWKITEIVSTESTGPSEYPASAVDSSGNIHVVWEDTSDYASAGGGIADIFYKRFDVSSSSWTTTEVVSTESSGEAVSPCIAIDSKDNIHVAWCDATNYGGAGADNDIFYKWLNATTSTWSTIVIISLHSTLGSREPSIAIDSFDSVHFVWEDDSDHAFAGTDMDIFYRRWDAVLHFWTATFVISTESTSDSESPDIAIDEENNIHVTWFDWTNYASSGADNDIFYKCYNRSYPAWMTTEVVSTESAEISYDPVVAIDSEGDVHIAWYDDSQYASAGGDWDIFYKYKDISLASWTITDVVSTESTGGSLYPSIAIDSTENIHLAWTDYTNILGAGAGEYDIFYKRWDASTSSWTSLEVVSIESTAHSFNPSLAVDSAGTIHIAWDDTTNYASSGSDEDIHYTFFTGPPDIPELAFIFPNPTEDSSIFLDWNDVFGAAHFYVYRSSSYIWSEELEPISMVTSSEYIDTISEEGLYYYVVVAGNFVDNSSRSNCQNVEVIFPGLNAPELAPILPNPTNLDSVSLHWNSIDGALEYHVYRSTSYIWSLDGLLPLDSAPSNSYIDSLPSEGYYFYVIVAIDGIANSTHSNCEYVEYKLPHVREFSIISSLILAMVVFTFVTMRTRKKKSNPN